MSENENMNEISENSDTPKSCENSDIPMKTASKSCGCGNMPDLTLPYPYIYALGTIDYRFPTESVENEVYQAVGRINSEGLSDNEAMAKVLSDSNHRYLARKLCWVFTVSGLETYILKPQDYTDIELLIKALSNRRSSLRAPLSTQPFADLIIGLRGPLATPETCNGLIVPIVYLTQVYSFEIQELIQSIPRPEKMSETKFTSASQEVFSRIMLSANNTGSNDEHRAMNYLSVRFPGIYEKATEMYGDNFSLYAIESRTSRASIGRRKVIDVIFSYRNRTSTFVEKYYVPVDVTEEFPFIIGPMEIYIEQ